MKLLPIAGHPPINRFIRGHLYFISPAYIGTTPVSLGTHYLVGVFSGVENGNYKFLKVVDNCFGRQSSVFYLNKKNKHPYYVRETSYEDTPLYMNATYLSPLYKKILAGETRYGRVLSKTKAAREVNFRKKVNLTGKSMITRKNTTTKK